MDTTQHEMLGSDLPVLAGLEAGLQHDSVELALASALVDAVQPLTSRDIDLVTISAAVPQQGVDYGALKVTFHGDSRWHRSWIVNLDGYPVADGGSSDQRDKVRPITKRLREVFGQPDVACLLHQMQVNAAVEQAAQDVREAVRRLQRAQLGVIGALATDTTRPELAELADSWTGTVGDLLSAARLTA